MGIGTPSGTESSKHLGLVNDGGTFDLEIREEPLLQVRSWFL